MTTIISLIRGLVEDVSARGIEVFTYDAEKIFTINEPILVSASIKVFINSVETSDFTADYTTCKVTVNASLSSGDAVEIRYNYYLQYSDTELEGFINSALSWLSVCKYCNSAWADNVDDFVVKDSTILPTPTTAEKRLIALVASILIDVPISYRTPDFGIAIRDSESKEDKVRKIIRGFKSRLGIFKIIEKETEDNE